MTKFGLLPILAALGTALCGCGAPGDLSRIVTSGHVEATKVRVSTKIPGRLESFPVKEGDRVASGQELARIDTVDIRLALDAARADRGQVDAELRIRLSGARPEEIAEAEAHVTRVEADLAGAQQDLERMQGLLDAGSGTDKARDDARTRRDVNESVLRGARDRLRLLRAGFRREEIEAARARLAAADARIAQLEQQKSDAVILSPVTGIVTGKLVERGELLPAGAALAVVTDLSDAWLTIYVGEPDLARIRIGQQTEVVTDDGQSRSGKISFISSEAEFTPKNVQTRDERVKLVFKVKVSLENADGLFKPGMPAEARLRAASPSP
jgi:HlyD family secretion protein